MLLVYKKFHNLDTRFILKMYLLDHLNLYFRQNIFQRNLVPTAVFLLYTFFILFALTIKLISLSSQM